MANQSYYSPKAYFVQEQNPKHSAVNIPAKFGLTCRANDNRNKMLLCIHRAPPDTHERFIGFLIKHYAGKFPLWFAPDQALISYVQAGAVSVRLYHGSPQGAKPKGEHYLFLCRSFDEVSA